MKFSVKRLYRQERVGIAIIGLMVVAQSVFMAWLWR